MPAEFHYFDEEDFHQSVAADVHDRFAFACFCQRNAAIGFMLQVARFF
jgi:hypothetical protein